MISLVVIFIGCSVVSSRVTTASWTSQHPTQEQHFAGGGSQLQNGSNVLPFHRRNEVELTKIKEESSAPGSFLSALTIQPILNSKLSRKLSFSDAAQNLSSHANFSVQSKNSNSNLNLQPVSSTLVSINSNNSAVMEPPRSRQKRRAFSCTEELRRSGDTVTEYNTSIKVTAYDSKLPFEIQAVVYMCCSPGTFLVNLTALSYELRITSSNTWETIEVKVYREVFPTYYKYFYVIERQSTQRSTQKQVITDWVHSYGVERIVVSIIGDGVKWFKSTNCSWVTTTYSPLRIPTERFTTTTTTAAAATTTSTTSTTIPTPGAMREEPPGIYSRTNAMKDASQIPERDDPGSKSHHVFLVTVLLVLVVIIIVLVVVIVFFKKKYDRAQTELELKSPDTLCSRDNWQAMRVDKLSTPGIASSQTTRVPTSLESPVGYEAIYEDPPECSYERYISSTKSGNPITKERYQK